MTRDFPYKNIWKIGFLNENKEELFEEYSKHFDELVLDDGPLTSVNEILLAFA